MEANDKYPYALPKGTILSGQYIIDRVLGQSGFGITYQARDTFDPIMIYPFPLTVVLIFYR